MEPAEREPFYAERSDALPAGRPGAQRDFGDAVVGILSARYLTGQTVVLDGGDALIGG